MPSTEEQLVQIYEPTMKEGVLKVTAVPFLQQKGATDCGLFSTAAAYHSALGQGVAKISFSQDDLREHLIECLEQRELAAFPPALAPVLRNPCKHMFVEEFCYCKRPESYDSKMIQCDGCEGWYHFKYVGLNRQAPKTWYCDSCT